MFSLEFPDSVLPDHLEVQRPKLEARRAGQKPVLKNHHQPREEKWDWMEELLTCLLCIFV